MAQTVFTKKDEVRAFLAALDKQLTQEGFFMNRIRFIRSDDGQLNNIYIDYEEKNTDTDDSDTDRKEM